MPDLNTIDYSNLDRDRRFGGVSRLYGTEALQRFQTAHVCIIGIGGVGSWSAEAIARSGIGVITLIDLDHIHESNINRQIHSLDPEIGKAKVVAMAERIRGINPECRVNAIEDFIALDNLAQLITKEMDYVIDAIDSVKVKAALVAHCYGNRIPIVTTGGAGGKIDPTRIQVSDLSRTEQDPLLAKVRKLLRQQYDFPRERRRKFGIEAVSSSEPMMQPTNSQSCSTEPEEMGLTGLNCAGLGSTVCVTANFGLIAASRVLVNLAQGKA